MYGRTRKRVDEVNQSEVEVMLEPLNYGSNHDEESRIKSPGFGYGLFLVAYTFIPR